MRLRLHTVCLLVCVCTLVHVYTGVLYCTQSTSTARPSAAPEDEALYWPAERVEERYQLNREELSIAIGGAILLRECPGLTPDTVSSTLDQSSALLVDLIPTFCATASPGYVYYMYLAYDFDDPCLKDDGNAGIVRQHLTDTIAELCPASVRVMPPRFIRCAYSGKPAWSQNEAMMAAYWHNVSYFYRVNDDTNMTTSGWTEIFMGQLNAFSPRNLGVVGPTHTVHAGNTNILTFDFTHRTHVDIFGYYYPDDFPDWYADGWITRVYENNKRMKKINEVKLVHTKKEGTRYDHRKGITRSELKEIVDHSAAQVAAWVEHVQFILQHTSTDDVACANVVSCALVNTSMPVYLQALRTVVTVKTLLPARWCCRVYVPRDMPARYTAVLEQYGAQVLRVIEESPTENVLNSPLKSPLKLRENEIKTMLKSHQWPYLAMLDNTKTLVAVKTSAEQLSVDAAKEIMTWEDSVAPVLPVSGFKAVRTQHILDTMQNNGLDTNSVGAPEWLELLNI